MKRKPKILEQVTLEMRKIKDEMSDLRAALRQQLNIVADRLRAFELKIIDMDGLRQKDIQIRDLADERSQLHRRISELIKEQQKKKKKK